MGEKRMLEGPGWPQGKHSMHEEIGVDTTNASGLAAAPVLHPSAAKKPRKAPALCLHQRVRSRCKDCGGSGLCEHQRQRSTCKDCGGIGLCEHQRVRSQCKDCGSISLCEHQRTSTPAGARRGRRRRSLCTCSSPTGARRGRRCRSLCTCSLHRSQAPYSSRNICSLHVFTIRSLHVFTI